MSLAVRALAARSLGTGLLAAALTLHASSALAHAPQGRSAALTSDAGAMVISMPGFGILLQHAPGSFQYVCDALLGDQPTDIVPALAFLDDGTLLMGTINGVRIVPPSGCPVAGAAGSLSNATIVALAADPVSHVVYAVASGDQAGLWRSDDGGKSWSSRGPLSGAALVTGLLLAEGNPNQLYLSKGSTLGHSTVMYSSDGGETFTSVDQDRALTFLHVPTASSTRLWALAASASNTTNRGFDVLHADSLQGPWTSTLTVNYFGGFTIDPSGVIWVGDEGGGVYRSDDHGDSFQNVAPQAATACLTYESDALWACTPGTNTQPALSRQLDGGADFAGVVAFGDVAQMVDCSPAVDVSQVCALAWLEWRRDVLMMDVSGQDAGVLADAGAASGGPIDAGLEASDAGVAPILDDDAGSSLDAGLPVSKPASDSSSGCAIAVRRADPRQTDRDAFALATCVAIAVLFGLRRLRRTRGRSMPKARGRRSGRRSRR